MRTLAYRLNKYREIEILIFISTRVNSYNATL